MLNVTDAPNDFPSPGPAPSSFFIAISGTCVRRMDRLAMACSLRFTFLNWFGHCCAFCEIGDFNSKKETTMKSSTRDKVEGTLHEVKGKVKETAGKLSDNKKLKAEGTVEKIAGKAQKKVGQAKKVLGK
jgi:uncharacterized protein YjbJ (UPF0337 family)